MLQREKGCGSWTCQGARAVLSNLWKTLPKCRQVNLDIYSVFKVFPFWWEFRLMSTQWIDETLFLFGLFYCFLNNLFYHVIFWFCSDCLCLCRHCFGPDSEFLRQLIFFFNAQNMNDFSVLVETCRLLQHFVRDSGTFIVIST